jgi:solute carrier family 25 carnitine/acylcarnitine transporter 20/29
MSFPLDTVKVRMQTTSGLYTGMVDCITKVAKQEGLKTFYRGVMAPVASYGIIKASGLSNIHIPRAPHSHITRVVHRT